MQNEQAIAETDNRNLCHFQMAVKVGVNGNQSFRYDPYSGTVYTDLLAEDGEDLIPGQQDNVAITAQSEHPALRRLWNLTRPYREMFDQAEMESNEGFVPIEDPHAKPGSSSGDVNERTAINQQSPALEAEADFEEEIPPYREAPMRSAPTDQPVPAQKPEGYYTREDVKNTVESTRLIDRGEITIGIYHSLLVGLVDKNDPNLAMVNNLKEEYDRLYDDWDL